MSFVLPDLPYPANGLEPVLSEEIMLVHHDKHHATYVKNLNKAVLDNREADQKNELFKEICIQKAISFNGGGHLNHSLFWANLIPIKDGGGVLQEGKLKEAIIRDFGSFDALKEKLSTMTTAIPGSGWGWLVYDKAMKRLSVMTTLNHDIPEAQGFTPLLTIDAWEHAYYLQYKNMRADYVKAIWSIINWKEVENRFLKAQ